MDASMYLNLWMLGRESLLVRNVVRSDGEGGSDCEGRQ